MLLLRLNSIPMELNEEFAFLWRDSEQSTVFSCSSHITLFLFSISIPSIAKSETGMQQPNKQQQYSSWLVKMFSFADYFCSIFQKPPSLLVAPQLSGYTWVSFWPLHACSVGTVASLGLSCLPKVRKLQAGASRALLIQKTKSDFESFLLHSTPVPWLFCTYWEH